MKNKKLLIAAIALVAVVGVLLGVFFATRPDTQEGMKNFTVTVVHGDGTSKDFTYRSTQAFLGPVLEEEGLIVGTEGPYGVFISHVDGEKAVYEEDNAYWSVYIGDEVATVGADQIPLTDGGVYKLVYTGA